MAEERITERTDGVTTERIVERGEPHTTVVERRGGGGAILIAIVLLIAVIVGAYLLMNADARENAETDAVTEAAGEIGDAVRQVGDAADRAADSVTGEGE